MPKVTIGKNVKLFALENRKALLEANRRLINDADFYDDVRRGFSR